MLWLHITDHHQPSCFDVISIADQHALSSSFLKDASILRLMPFSAHPCVRK
jgi:hypothetical protein